MDLCEKIFFDKNIPIVEFDNNKNFVFEFFLTLGLKTPEKRKKIVMAVKKILTTDEFKMFSDLYIKERDPDTNLLYQYGYLDHSDKITIIYDCLLKVGTLLMNLGGAKPAV